jgi:hypothetical protein
MRQCRGEVADSMEKVGKLLNEVGHTKHATQASNADLL